MTSHLEVSHAFDAAHRLPNLPGKCTSLHGHTWRVRVSIAGEASAEGIVMDMSEVKRTLAGFVDQELDHATMLGADDPLTDVLTRFGMRVYVFDGSGGWHWPTVEAVAATIAARLQHGLTGFGVDVTRVWVSETDRNAAVWTPDRTVAQGVAA